MDIIYLLANARATGDKGLIPGLERSPEGGNGNPLQDCCWDDPVERSPAAYKQSWRLEEDMTERTHTRTHTHARAHTRT